MENVMSRRNGKTAQGAGKMKKWDLTDMRAVLLLAGLCCFLWGSATPAIKTGYRLFGIEAGDTPSILLFAGVRFFMAGLLVILFYSLQKHHFVRPAKGSAPALFSLAATQTAGQYLFFYIGLSYASGVHGAIITGTNVFFSIVVASLVFHYEVLSFRKLFGCLLGFAGIVMVNLAGAGGESGSGVSFMGEGFVLIAQLFYAFSGALVKKYSKEFDVVMLSAVWMHLDELQRRKAMPNVAVLVRNGGVMIMSLRHGPVPPGRRMFEVSAEETIALAQPLGLRCTLGGLALAAVGAAMGGSLLGAVDYTAYVLLLYMGGLSAVAYTLWGILLKHNPVSRVTIFGFMNPMFGVILSAIFLGESAQALNGTTLAALVLVCLGIYVVNGGKMASEKTF